MSKIGGENSQADAPDMDVVRRIFLTEVLNEFAGVRLYLDSAGNGDRLLIEDLDTHDVVYLCPLELASITRSTDADRERWLHVGAYRDERGE